MISYVKKAAAINDEGMKAERRPAAAKAPLRLPADLKASLKKNAAARKHFDAFSRSRKREYVEWITDARTDATRGKRLATALAWIAEGKPRHWKYDARMR